MNPLRPILLVEDSVKDVQLIAAALRKTQLHNELIVMPDGQEALDYLLGNEHHTDCKELPLVIFLDLKMPRVDGFEVIRQIKKHELLKLIPIVVLTSSREECDLIRSYRFGANAYVVKPVGFKALVDTIAQTGEFWTAVNEPPPTHS